MLIFQPPVLVLFYEKGFSQLNCLACKILFFGKGSSAGTNNILPGRKMPLWTPEY
jgi:hypothetical protein